MIDLRTLGSLDLRVRDGPALLSVLAQPKRTALLCYLALARPRGFQRRDTLLALFWPEADAEHARSSLRQAVHFLRRSLGDDVIASRGDDDLAIGAGVLECDAVAFEAALAAGERERALGLYRGDLLPGFHVEGAPDFERWLEAERARLRGLAVAGACALAEAREGAGDAGRAAEWARAAFTLASDDAALRRLMQTLARLGDPQAALAAYESWMRRLHAEYELEPSPEARALAEEIRTRGRPAGAPRAAPAAVDPGAAERPGEPVDAPSPAERHAEPVPTAPQQQPPPRPGRWRHRRWLAAATVAFAVIAVGGALLLRQAHGTPPPAAAADPASVAVLPLEDLSPGHDQAYFADGVTEELISLLGTVPGLRVPGRTSSFYFRDKRLPVQEIARQLGVRHLLEGSVRKVGREVTVTVDLTDAATGRMLWSRPFQATGGDVVALQRELARLVLASVAVGFTLRAFPRAPRVPEAYDLYLQGLYSTTEEWRTLEWGMVRALDLFRRALDLDPGFAPARAALAYAYYRAGDWEHAKAAARQALAGDSTLVLARIALGSSLAHGDWQWAEAERELDRAVQLAPSLPDAYLARSTIRGVLGRVDDALADIDRAEQLDPYGGPAVVREEQLLNARRYEEAIAAIRRIPPADTALLSAISLADDLFTAYMGAGHHVQAESLAVAWGWKRAAARARGNRAEMLELVRPSTPPTCRRYRFLFESLGMTDAIVDCLEYQVNTRWRFIGEELRFFSFNPAVAANPRFQALMKRVGLAP